MKHNKLGEDSEGETKGIFILFAIMLTTYSLIGSYMEKAKPPIFHETGVIILIGITVSYIIHFQNEKNDKWFEFPKYLFFEVLLPLIILASGYNMKRKKFFQNMVNIVRFGVMGTVLTFIIYSSMTYGAFKTINFYDNNGEKWELDGL